MDFDFRKELREALLESYQHRAEPGTKCAMCGVENGRYAFHVIEFAQYTPRGHIDGSFPLCEKCAPPCKKCKMPIRTSSVIKFYKKRLAENFKSLSIHWGVGVCEMHMHILGITI